jgi:hypothetical protein
VGNLFVAQDRLDERENRKSGLGVLEPSEIQHPPIVKPASGQFSWMVMAVPVARRGGLTIEHRGVESMTEA